MEHLLQISFWSLVLTPQNEKFHHLSLMKQKRGGSDCATACSLANNLSFISLPCLNIELPRLLE